MPCRTDVFVKGEIYSNYPRCASLGIEWLLI
jgi:hypothetical protein